MNSAPRNDSPSSSTRGRSGSRYRTISTPAASASGCEEVERLVDLGVQIGRLQVEPPHLGEVEEVVEQVLQPLALALHDVDALGSAPLRGRLRLFEVLGQQLHVEPDRRERILDLVGQRPGEPRDLGVLREQPLVADRVVSGVAIEPWTRIGRYDSLD